jgi:hypothetical protein
VLEDSKLISALQALELQAETVLGLDAFSSLPVYLKQCQERCGMGKAGRNVEWVMNNIPFPEFKTLPLPSLIAKFKQEHLCLTRFVSGPEYQHLSQVEFVHSKLPFLSNLFGNYLNQVDMKEWYKHQSKSMKRFVAGNCIAYGLYISFLETCLVIPLLQHSAEARLVFQTAQQSGAMALWWTFNETYQDLFKQPPALMHQPRLPSPINQQSATQEEQFCSGSTNPGLEFENRQETLTITSTNIAGE